MKKILFAAFLLIIADATFAQKSPGCFTVYPKIGVNLSKFSGDLLSFGVTPAEGIIMKKSEMKSGFNAGADLRYRISDNYGASIGLIYSNLGNRFDSEDLMEEYKIKESKWNNHYLQIPIMMHTFLTDGLSVNIGIQPAMLIAAQNSNKLINDSKEKEEGITTVSGNVKNIFKTFEFSIPLGVSYEYRNILFDLRYQLGLTGVYKYGGMTSGNPKISAFSFSVAYGFDL